MITWVKLGDRVYGTRDGYVIRSDDVYEALINGAVIFWHKGEQVTYFFAKLSPEEARADFEDWARTFEVEIPSEYKLKQWGL